MTLRIEESIEKANKRQKQYKSKVLKYHKRLQFFRKIRTTYINGKKVKDLIKVLKSMLKHNSFTIKFGSKKHTYQLGSNLYLIDVRYNTYYKSKKIFPENKEQWFEPENLRKLFKKIDNIKYRYFQALGNPKNIRIYLTQEIQKIEEKYNFLKKDIRFQKKLIELKKRKRDLILSILNKAKDLYLKHINSNSNSQSQFKKLYTITNSKRPLYQICLICYCEPKKNHIIDFCHRFWLKEALLKRYCQEYGIEGEIPTIPHYPTNYFEKKYEAEK